MKDTLLNLLVGVVIVAILAGTIMGLLAMGKRWHAAEACMEDEAWVAVHFETEGAFEDSHGVTRACVNVEELIGGTG